MLSLSLNRSGSLLLAFALLAFSASPAGAQTTAFTYQGKLNESGNPANGNYDFEFKLFDALSAGAQQGATVQRLNVTVTNGIFVVGLDFGNQFTGASRFLDISVRTAGGGAFTPLAPRQQVTSNPYAIKSLNAVSADSLSVACVNCVTSSQIASVAGSAVTGTIPIASVPAGSGNYVQNTSSEQAASNFNISGSGTAAGTLSANLVNATTQYNIAGVRVLSKPGFANLFAGGNAGQVNTGQNNSFFGNNAGQANTSGESNAFFGSAAGFSNSTGEANSFFGTGAGLSNTTSSLNSFFGNGAGGSNTLGFSNSFFGYRAGGGTTFGSQNVFLGSFAGLGNTSGSENTFVGINAGAANTIGSGNTLIGESANVGAANLFFATAIGASAVVNTSNTVVLGRNLDTVQIPGLLNVATQYNIGGNRVLSIAGSLNVFAGVGAGRDNTTGGGNSFFGFQSGFSNTEGSQNSFFGGSAGQNNKTGIENAFFGFQAGHQNTASRNSLFGSGAGESNTTGSLNAFFGTEAGNANVSGSANSFFGYRAGFLNTAGGNTLFGNFSGASNTSGANNTFIGNNAGISNTTGSNNTIVGNGADVNGVNHSFATAIGAGAIVSSSDTVVIGRSSDDVRVPGNLVVTPATGGIQDICRNILGQIATCSSSLRYKTGVRRLNGGLDIVRRLRPISFTWRDAGMRDVGLGAEDVEKVDPLLVTYSRTGQVEGVKYKQLSVVLINAVQQQQAQLTQQQRLVEQQCSSIQQQQNQLKEQQRQFQQLQKEFSRQQQQLETLRQLICRKNPRAKACN